MCPRATRSRPAGPARGGRRPRDETRQPRPGRRRDRPLRIANCSGFYGDRLAAPREMVEGGPDRRAHRRLVGRAHHAHPVEGLPARPLQGLGPYLPHPDGGGAGYLRRPRHQGGDQRRRPQPGRAGRPGARRWPSGSGSPSRWPTSRATTSSPASTTSSGRATPWPTSTPADPWPRRRATVMSANAYLGGLAHRRGAGRRGRRRRLPPDHRCLPGGGAGGLAPRLVPAPTGTGWPGRWWPGTSSSAAPRPPGATTPSSPRSPGSSIPASPWPRWPRTARRSSPSTRGPAGRCRWDGHRPAPLRDRRPPLPQRRCGGPFDTFYGREQGPDRVRISGTAGSPPRAR